MEIGKKGSFSVFVMLLVFCAVIWGLGEALIPILLAAFAAYFMHPLIRRLEARGIRKTYAVSAALLISVLFSALFFRLLIPVLVEDVKSFLAALPEITDSVILRLDAVANRFGYEFPLDKGDLKNQAQEFLTQLPMGTFKSAGLAFTKFLTGTAGIVLLFLNLVLIPIFFFYLTLDYDRLTRGVKSLIPPRRRKDFDAFVSRSNEIISAYFRGQILVVIVLGLLYGTGFLAVGLRFGFVIGVLTGMLNVIPYAGPAMGLGIATIVAFANFKGMGAVVSVWAVFSVVQMLESFVITPKIVGDRVGLTDLETFIVLIVGGNLAGFAGMLVAIPAGGIIKYLLSQTKKSYLKSPLYLEK